jgi:hypothetical protein
MALFNKGTNILSTDFIKNDLYILDLNCKKITSVRLNDSLNFPLGIRVQVKENGDEYIFLTHNIADKVFLLNSSFQVIKTIGERFK